MRVGIDIDEVYQQNKQNFQPRVGFAWSLCRRRNRGARRVCV